MQRRVRWDRPRYVSLAVSGDTPILWKLPASYRCISYGDIAEEERRLRWIVRRWVVAIVLGLSSYFAASGPWMAAVRMNAIPATGWPARIIETSFLPVKMACHACPPLMMAMRPWHECCDSLFMQKTKTGWRPGPLWWAWVAAWAIVAYALSPVPAWFVACLFSIERLPPVTEFLEIVFAPLIVLADFSTNVREFYEAYGDWREAVD